MKPIIRTIAFYGGLALCALAIAYSCDARQMLKHDAQTIAEFKATLEIEPTTVKLAEGDNRSLFRTTDGDRVIYWTTSGGLYVVTK